MRGKGVITTQPHPSSKPEPPVLLAASWFRLPKAAEAQTKLKTESKGRRIVAVHVVSLDQWRGLTIPASILARAHKVID